jgi:ABC-type nickel/cobalt efflux system permease component RcnA
MSEWSTGICWDKGKELQLKLLDRILLREGESLTHPRASLCSSVSTGVRVCVCVLVCCHDDVAYVLKGVATVWEQESIFAMKSFFLFNNYKNRICTLMTNSYALAKQDNTYTHTHTHTHTLFHTHTHTHFHTHSHTHTHTHTLFHTHSHTHTHTQRDY